MSDYNEYIDAYNNWGLPEVAIMLKDKIKRMTFITVDEDEFVSELLYELRKIVEIESEEE